MLILSLFFDFPFLVKYKFLSYFEAKVRLKPPYAPQTLCRKSCMFEYLKDQSLTETCSKSINLKIMMSFSLHLQIINKYVR